MAACAVRWTPSTASSAPASCTAAAMAGTGGRGPIRLLAPVTATRFVRSLSTVPTSSSSQVAGSNGSQRTVAPAASAASTHGRTLASWSSRVTTTSSPGPQPAASVRARSIVRAVALRPKTIPPGSACSRSPIAARAARTTSSALRSAAVIRPRFAIGEVSVSATARATGSGTCVPPGPSKWAVPARSAGKAARTASTSYVMRPTLPRPAVEQVPQQAPDRVDLDQKAGVAVGGGDHLQRDVERVGHLLLLPDRVEPVAVDAGDHGPRRHPAQRRLDPAPAAADVPAVHRLGQQHVAAGLEPARQLVGVV